MKVYKGSCASPGLVLGQVSRLEHHVETTTVGPFKPSRELQLLTDAIRTAQDELESMADRAAPSEQAIFQFQFITFLCISHPCLCLCITIHTIQCTIGSFQVALLLHTGFPSKR